jgi:hypothetical protein
VFAVSTVMRLVVNVALLVVLGCVDTPRLHEPDIEASHVEIKDMPGGFVPKLDVLVLLDDSVAMLPYQQRVATLAPLLARRLGELTSQWVDIQIAVTGNDGQFRPAGDAAYLRDTWAYDYTHAASFDGPLVDALARLLHTDAATAAPAQPLEAMVRALERNALFVRDDAAFAVVIVSASDDASPLPTGEYVRWMQAFAGDSSGWFRKPVIAIGIHPQPTPRLDEYYAALDAVMPAIVTPIDATDYAPAIAQLQPLVRSHLVGGPCLESLHDLDPAGAGFQHECTMHVRLGDALRTVPECSATAPPTERSIDAWVSAPAPACWELVPDYYNCFYGSGMTIRFRGYTSFSHPAYRLECRTR